MQGQLHLVIYTHPPPSPWQGLGLLQHISSSGNVGQARLQLQPRAGLAGTLLQHSFPGAGESCSQQHWGHLSRSIPELLTSNSDSLFRLGTKNNLLLMVLMRKNTWYHHYLVPPPTPELPLAVSPAPNPSSFLFPLCY